MEIFLVKTIDFRSFVPLKSSVESSINNDVYQIKVLLVWQILYFNTLPKIKHFSQEGRLEVDFWEEKMNKRKMCQLQPENMHKHLTNLAPSFFYTVHQKLN